MAENTNVLWVVHIGNNDRIALRGLNEGFVCVGWTKMGDLSLQNNRSKMRAAMEIAYPAWKPRTVSSSYGQTYRFAHKMRIGDPLIFPVRPTGEIAIGKVSGAYQWSDDPDLISNDYNNVRPIEWLNVVSRTIFSQAALHSFGSFLTVSTSNDYLEEVQTVLQTEILTSEQYQESITEDSDPMEEEAAAFNLYETATQETEDYLLKAWHKTGAAFEEVVGAVFEALGYTVTVTQASSDHGVDIVAHPDALGLERPFIKIQVKSGLSTVGEPEVNQLKGSLNPGEQGVFVSLGKFSPSAQAVERNNPNMIFLGSQRFVRLFLDHYGELAPEWRAKFPLKQVFIPLS